jgi:Rps23 Pro-64 3,4-dihydroxylase Tpa1-like proline 4-hydroxylase
MPLLNLAVFDNTPLQHDPFEFLLAGDMLSAEALEQINRDFPQIEIPANFTPENLQYGPVFRQLLAELDSEKFQAALENKFGMDLGHTTRTITVRKYSELSDGNIHTDHPSKILTVLMYFNKEWNQAGGRLRLLRSKTDIEDYAAEASPVGGTLLAFRRSAKSFHGYKRFAGERRMLQVNWVKSSRLAWYAQQLSRLGTHTGKRLLRAVRRV